MKTFQQFLKVRESIEDLAQEPMQPEEKARLEAFVKANAKDDESRQMYFRTINRFVAEKRSYDWVMMYLKSRDDLSGQANQSEPANRSENKVQYLENLEAKLKQFAVNEMDKENATDDEVKSLYGQLGKWMDDAYRRCEGLKNSGGDFKRFENSYYRIREMLDQVKSYLRNPEHFQWFSDNGISRKKSEPVTPTKMYRTYLIHNGVSSLADAIGMFLFGIHNLTRGREIEQERDRKAKEAFASAKPMQPEEQERLEAFVKAKAKNDESRELYLRAVKRFVAEKRPYDWVVNYLKGRDDLN